MIARYISSNIKKLHACVGVAHLGSVGGASHGLLHPGVREPPLHQPRGEHAGPERHVLLLRRRRRLPQHAGRSTDALGRRRLPGAPPPPRLLIPGTPRGEARLG